MIRRNGFRQTIVMPPKQAAATPCPECPECPEVPAPVLSFGEGYVSKPSPSGGSYTFFDDAPGAVVTAATLSLSTDAGTIDFPYNAVAAVRSAVSVEWAVTFTPASSGPTGGTQLANITFGEVDIAFFFDPLDSGAAFGVYSITATVNGETLGPITYTVRRG